MKKTLKEIAELIGGELAGDPDLEITGINGLKEAVAGDLTFIANQKFEAQALKTKASAIIVATNANVSHPALIRIKNPSSAFGKVVYEFRGGDKPSIVGIHALSCIDEAAQIGKNVTVGPYAVIEKGVVVGDNSVISGGCYISYNASIGENTVIYPNVSIRQHCIIGNRVIIHSGTVIGSDGFGFEKIDGRHQKIPQVGIVVIEDDVEMGANVAIDRARFDKTIIGRGTKIDNLVHIAHNCVIGENCIIIAQAGVSGSTILERDVILAGQVGVIGHVVVGEGTVVASKSAVLNSVPPHSMVWGNPALPHMKQKRNNVLVQRLPDLVKKIKALEAKVKRLEENK